jgi:nucleotide-binding universal stress UspA family protein
MHIVLAAKPGVDQPWVADAAARLATQTSGTVSVVSVDQVELERLAPLPREVYLERAQRAVEGAAERLAAAGVPATTAVLSGRPVERILEYADEQDADIVMIGASSRSTVTERLLGSVPLELIKRSRRPVLVMARSDEV